MDVSVSRGAAFPVVVTVPTSPPGPSSHLVDDQTVGKIGRDLDEVSSTIDATAA
jgi:hypothetical protein